MKRLLRGLLASAMLTTTVLSSGPGIVFAADDSGVQIRSMRSLRMHMSEPEAMRTATTTMRTSQRRMVSNMSARILRH